MYRVLIVDNNASVREGIKCLFDYEALGFTIAGEASSADAAYQAICTLQPDVVFMDICMPGMTGLDVIRGEQYYLTKPIDADELEGILRTIKIALDKEKINTDATAHYRLKARDSIIKDILLGKAKLSSLNLSDMHLEADVYQMVIYEKYSQDTADASYPFADLLRVTNYDNHSFDHILLQFHEVFLLKGQYAIQKFENFLIRYQEDNCSLENCPQKNSPLDTLFITYGRQVSSLEEIPLSYQEAQRLLSRRFFCNPKQHTLGYTSLSAFENNKPVITRELLTEYTSSLLDYIQTFNRPMAAQTLKELQIQFFNASDSAQAIKLFMIDLYLQIKERMNHLYPNNVIPFPGNTDIIQTIGQKFFLHEIILFFTEQFEIIMSATGSSSRDSVLNDILHYINHNYSSNITLESIAPLFGYNSSYLGKIFHQKMGKSFNSYVDFIRIEHSKELLLNENLKVYSIAERVGYCNVDYFHVKFKKYVGQSPAEFRKKKK